MVYVTGDLHGEIDIHKLTRTTQRKNLYKSDAAKVQMPGKGDFLIICGDFGLVWYDENETGYKQQKYWLDWVTKQPYTTLFVDGNHENFALLNAYPKTRWHGGVVQKITPKVYHLMRGYVYNIDGSTFFAFGGASSHDKQYRTEGYSWWPEELPMQCEIARAKKNLAKCGYNVDYVITHCSTTAVQRGLRPTYPIDDLNLFFDELDSKLTYTRWYNGHYHEDTDIGKHSILYYKIVAVPTGKQCKCSGSLQ